MTPLYTRAPLSPLSCSFNCADCRCSVPYRAGIMDLQVQISESNILFSITSSARTLVLFFTPNAPRPHGSSFFNVALSCTRVWGSRLCVHWLYLFTASQRLKKKKKCSNAGSCYCCRYRAKATHTLGKVSNAQSHSRGSVYEEHLLWFIAHKAASVMNLMCSRQSWRSEKLWILKRRQLVCLQQDFYYISARFVFSDSNEY